jgi:hypothetical protein
VHSKLKSSSPVCIQIGLFTLVELVFVESKTTSFMFPKVLALAKPQGVVGKYNFFQRIVMQLDCKGSSIAANEPTKNNGRSLVGDLGISNLEGFSREVK